MTIHLDHPTAAIWFNTQAQFTFINVLTEGNCTCTLQKLISTYLLGQEWYDLGNNCIQPFRYLSLKREKNIHYGMVKKAKIQNGCCCNLFRGVRNSLSNNHFWSSATEFITAVISPVVV